jgi:hypothetical protein
VPLRREQTRAAEDERWDREGAPPRPSVPAIVQL